MKFDDWRNLGLQAAFGQERSVVQVESGRSMSVVMSRLEAARRKTIPLDRRPLFNKLVLHLMLDFAVIFHDLI